MKAAILTLALLLTGTSVAQWEKIEQTEIEVALAACTALADQAQANANDDSVWVSPKKLIKSCMAVKGYAKPEKKKAKIVCEPKWGTEDAGNGNIQCWVE